MCEHVTDSNSASAGSKLTPLHTYLNVLISEPALIAKSNIILDVKPWDDETDMKLMEKAVRAVGADGLLWGACKYELHSLQFDIPHWP
jgi:hypothetical protein